MMMMMMTTTTMTTKDKVDRRGEEEVKSTLGSFDRMGLHNLP